MNLNDFVVLPNKPKSVKLNPSRNMRELRMETVQLAQENATMESRLKQLRENMSREKEERERSGGIRWKSGQAGPLSGGPTARRNRENAATSATATATAAAMPKVPGAKVKIRVLKDEPLPELPRRPVERPSVAGGGEQMPSRRPQLKGRACGQCEAREAGLMCPECGEDYCIGCFAKFHQKGALKLHRMIPMQAAVQTSVSALEVVQRFQTQVGSDSPKLGSAPTGDRKRKGEASWRSGEASAPATHYPVPSGSHEAARPRTASDEEEDDEEEEDDLEEDDLEEEEMEGRNVSPPRGGSSLLQGSFDEEESARSFQQALQQWRRGGGGGGKEEEEEAPGEGDGPADSQHMQQQPHRQRACRPRSDAMPVSVEATGTQADFQPLQPVRPIHVEFKQQGITYMEKLLIKKHRRTPIEEYRPLSNEASSTSSTPSTVAQEPLTPSHSSETDGESHRLTEEEKEMRSYLLSLFAVTPRGGARESPSPEPCISPLPLQPTVSIVELDQTVGDSAGTSAFGVERRQVNTKSREGLNESMMKCEREKKRDMVGSAGSSASKLRLSPGGQPPSPSGKWPVAPAPPPRPNPRASPPSPGPPHANSQHPSPPPPSSVQSSSSSSSSSLSPSGQLPAKASGGRLSRTPKSDKIKTSSTVEDGRSAKTRLKECPSKTPSPRSRLTTITPPGSSESQSANPQIAPKTLCPRSMLTPSPRLGTSKTGLTPSPPPLPRPPSADHHHQSPTPSSLELRSTNSRKRFQAPSPRGTLTPSPRLGSSKGLLTPSPPPAHVTTAAPPHTSSPSEIQSTDPLYTPSPSRLSSPGLRRPVEASTPVSSMEMTPETSMTETVSFRLLPRDSSSPQHAPVVPPLNITSTPPSAEHSTLSSHKQNSVPDEP
ncbi:histone-lysine N-methyltransferase SETD1B-like [Engraulis encrasicolus]|uniref:histone-lysine N-methyltransferase SETD1B-like n=1 Tax=Engraulis encrasicolus TaxID=184585 RepID=UPI002FD374A5